MGSLRLLGWSEDNVYNSEPDPASIEDAAEELQSAFSMRGFDTLASLRGRIPSAHTIAEHTDLEPKLQRRMLAALEAIGTDEGWAQAVGLPRNTIDHKHLCKLRQAAGRYQVTPKIVGRFRPWGMVGEESGGWKGRWKGTLLARVTFSEAAPPAPRMVFLKFFPVCLKK